MAEVSDACQPVAIANDLLRLSVIPLGARIVTLEVRERSAGWRSVILNLPDLNDYAADDASVGAIVGRYANRIRLGRCVLDGTVLQLDQNHGAHHLHGGFAGFGQQRWHLDASATAITCRINSRDGEGGYPGNLELTCRIALEDKQVVFEYSAHTDAPTFVNPSHHCYFNLAGRPTSLAGHRLAVAAGRFVEVDAEMIPTGALPEVTGRPLDLRQSPLLSDVLVADDPQLALAAGLDHCYVLDGAQPAATLQYQDLRMCVTTTEPGLQVYTANHYQPGRIAVCLETQHLPDSPNQPAFPSVRLDPEDTWTSSTTYTFDWL